MNEEEEVKGFFLKKGITVKELATQMSSAGFQATELGRAIEILREMKKENALIFLTFTSNMVSSGLRELFSYLCEKKLIDVIITTVGSVEEDFIKSKMPFLLGDFRMDDKSLEKGGINRIGNILVPNDRYEYLEKELTPIFGEMYKEKKIWAPYELAEKLGEYLDDKNSFLYWAKQNKIPIFIQAVTDGAIGLQLYFFKQNQHKDFVIDATAEEKLAEIVLNAKKTGGIILGGGVAKHHAIGVNILRGGFDYAIYVTTAGEGDGSLSGAKTKEAISWSKIKSGNKNHVTVEGDATILFPLLVSGWIY